MSGIQNKSRARALDGLRGVAACAVVFYHAILHNDLSLLTRVLAQPLQAMESTRDVLTKLALIGLNGEVAVYVFFVLSGCVLRRSLESHREDGGWTLSARFAAARAVRLYPPVIVAVLLLYALSQIGIHGYPVFTLRETLENAALWSTIMHGPSTTVQVELMAVPFILSAWLLRRRFGVGALALAFVYSILSIESSAMVFHLPNMNAYLFAFIAGMLVAEPALKFAVEQAPAGTGLVTMIGLVFSRTFAPQATISALIAMVIAAALLVSVLLHGRRDSLTTILESRPIQVLGRLSFSFYLLNVPILYLIWAFTDSKAWPKSHALEAGLITGIVAIALTWPLAWISERWIERPSIGASRWMWSILRATRAIEGESQARPGLRTRR